MPVSTVNNTDHFDIIVKNLRRRKVLFHVLSPFRGLKKNNEFNTRPPLTRPTVFHNSSKRRKSCDRQSLKDTCKSVDANRKFDLRSGAGTGVTHLFSIYEFPRKSYRREKSLPAMLKRTSHSLRNSDSDFSQTHSIYAVSRKSYRRKPDAKDQDNPSLIQEINSNDDSSSNITLNQLSVSTVSSSQSNEFYTEAFPLLTSSVVPESSYISSSLPRNKLESSKTNPKQTKRNVLLTEYRTIQQQEEKEPLSEYELQRQKNIEENLKMLRSILGEETDCQAQSQKSLKTRKTYERAPLPPPRPKSARIEKRSRYTLPLNFSKLHEMLNLN